MKRLYALRGAVQCENTASDIESKTAAMYSALLSQNALCEDDIVSAIFSVTADLNALNPCTALRNKGYAQNLSLFAACEPVYENSLERTVRVLIHCYLEEGTKLRHVYLNGAQVLRADRE